MAHALLDSPGDDGQFHATHWSVVLHAGDSQCPEAAASLEILCQRYRRPLYEFALRKIDNPHDAEDVDDERRHLVEILSR